MSPPSKTPTVAPGLVAYIILPSTCLSSAEIDLTSRSKRLMTGSGTVLCPTTPEQPKRSREGKAWQSNKRTSAVRQKKTTSVPQNIFFSTVHNDEYRMRFVRHKSVRTTRITDSAGLLVSGPWSSILPVQSPPPAYPCRNKVQNKGQPLLCVPHSPRERTRTKDKSTTPPQH